MIRKIIRIDEEKCDGCGLCAEACHEGAIGMINGKARLLRDDYCDGLGDCLPACPREAISFEEREAAAYDEEAVLRNKSEFREASSSCACPGSRLQSFDRSGTPVESRLPREIGSELTQWPVQIKLAPVNAPYFRNAHLLVAADCTAYAYADFHRRFIRNRITLIGCPKLDGVDYTDKLAAIIAGNGIKSLTVVRMDVPCCGGLVHMATEALKRSGAFIPWQVITISTGGDILE